MPLPSQILRNKFPFPPTRGQSHFFEVFDQFWANRAVHRPTMILKGYAGTGKTTLLSTLVEVLPLFNFKYVLLAPTGRAAKVISSYTRKKAFTIHKIIYRQVAAPEEATLIFKSQKNYHKKTLFIVDEASMLADDHSEAPRVLKDLIEFVFADESNRLLLIGDGAQLPPVGQVISAGLDRSKLQSHYHLSVTELELTEVMRQQLSSGILFNATLVRQALSNKETSVKFQLKQFTDVFRMSGDRFEEGIRYAHDKFGSENTIVICRSNKMAVRYNQFIRRSIFFYENELEAGDTLMIVRNNYFFLPEESKAGFLANGDFVEIRKIRSTSEVYGFRFADLELQLLDYPEQAPFEAKVILDTLHSETTSLTSDQNRQLYQEVQNDYLDIPASKRRKVLKNDPYLNALQIKFAYALTCHKSQGGQWKAVFVDQGYLTEAMVDADYLRWLYTAITRATSQLFFVNFHPNFF